MESEREETIWPLGGTACAIVTRRGKTLRTRLQGVVTAPVYEALHRRLAGEHAPFRELVLDHDALQVVTCRSAVEAAMRGTPKGARKREHPTVVLVPLTKLAWGLEFALLMTRAGLLHAASPLSRLPQLTTP